MPRGAPRRPTNLRLDPALVSEVLAAAKAEGITLTAAIEAGSRFWLRRPRTVTSPAEIAKYLALQRAEFGPDYGTSPPAAEAPAPKRRTGRRCVMARESR
jgi:hypothetical protein